ncbi:MAG TPA: glycoside hydrolase family 38 C-terminal domain-containing protein [bacterium]|nr:glycoside hydrolase family 38 C-terminal domain-containing protein [bacterium]
MKKKTFTFHILPQSHIDVVWLWRYDPETIHRCCKPTYTRALENMDRFPEYTFLQSQVPLYEPVEKHYPALFERIRKYIAEGRWEIVGGMYVEPEGSEPCGESFVRQCVLGKRYFQQKFGLDIANGWQADAWGHPSQLPQILKKAGIHAYLWRRGDAGGPRRRLDAKAPLPLLKRGDTESAREDIGEPFFWWEAPDGSRVLACRFIDPEKPPYAGFEKFRQICQERYGINDMMIVIGGGDHGGGPKAKEIEDILAFSRSTDSDVTFQFGTFQKFVDSVLAQDPKLPVWKEDLGFELHADMTNCGEIKKGNRECENLLMTAEKWASIAAWMCNAEYPREELEDAWKKLLFNQFHDVLGGSLLETAYNDAMVLYQSVRESCAYTIETATHLLSEKVNTQGQGTPVVVWNPLCWTRTDAVEAEVDFETPPQALSARNQIGKNMPVRILSRKDHKKGQKVRCLFLAEDIPATGYKTFHLIPTDEPASEPVSATDLQMENEFFLVELDRVSGNIRRILDKQNNREVLPETGGANALIAIEDEGDSEGRFDTRSDILGAPPGEAREIDTVLSVEKVENGPVRSLLRVHKQFQNSQFTQDIGLYPGIDRIDFRLEIDWHDIHTMIKIAFPLELENPTVNYDDPYAVTTRPADGLEYPAQKWVDLSSDGYGVALLNAGRYAHDVRGNVVRMSVLRSPTEPAYSTDEGKHELRYALCPHTGNWWNGLVKRKGHELNYPLWAVAESPHAGQLEPTFSFATVTPDHLILEVIKKADLNDDFILRVYETHGAECRGQITLPMNIRDAHEADLMEKEICPLTVSGNQIDFRMGAYEIKTIRIRI